MLVIVLVLLLMGLPYYFDVLAIIQSKNIGSQVSSKKAEYGFYEPVRKKKKKKNTNANADPKADLASPLSLISGSVGEDNIAYYHLPPTATALENHHLVLLHGASFTKEDWKTSGILGLFAKKFPSIAVTALDLPVKADHTVLEALLRSMRDEDLIEQLPISGLVTPSASGRSITTWIREESTSGLSSYVSMWIPVASYSVNKCTPAELETVGMEGVGVLAIYGDKDAMGKKVTDSLGDYAGATKLQLPGSHPVYLDSQEAFVEAIGNEILASE